MIGALLRLPLDAIIARILAGLHNAGFTDLIPAHFSIMRYPGPEGRRPSDLAVEARMTKQAMNYLLGQVEELGYLTRDDDPDDARSKRIHLTKRGHAAARTVRKTLSEIEAELERDLGPTQFRRLRQALIGLNDSNLVSDFHNADEDGS